MIAAACLLPAALAASAAQPIRVSGQVVSPDGSHGIANTRIQLLPAWEGYSEAVRRLRAEADPAPLAMAHSNAEGFFEITAQGTGAYRLRVQVDGYLPIKHLLVPWSRIRTWSRPASPRPSLSRSA